MYDNVREVVTGLILSLAYSVILAVVAIINPWGNHASWVSWLALAVVSTVAVIVATTALILGGLWELTFISFCAWTVVGGVIASSMTVTTADGISPQYHSLVWTVYAVPLLVLPLTATVQYLAGAVAERRKALNKPWADLHRVA